MSVKQDSRLRRCRKARVGMRKTRKVRLCVTRSNNYITAQLIEHAEHAVDNGATDKTDKVLGCVSSNQTELKAKLKGSTSSKVAAELVGSKIAELAKGLKISEVAFDRSGYKYHGCVAELANSARAGGLKF